MDDSLPSLSETQWEVMRAVWDLGEGTVSEVWGRLNERRPLARNTVLTQMERLVRKGWLVRQTPAEGAHRYRAAQSAEETRQEHLRRWLETAFEGAADQLVLSLLETESLSEDAVRRIRELIDDARPAKPAKSSRRRKP